MDKNMIMVWEYSDAPKNLKDLSNNGGDEDWIAVIPEHIHNKYYIGWLHSMGFDSCSEPQIYENVKEYPGTVIYIGSHA